MSIDTWSLAEIIAKYAKDFGAKLTKEELVDAIDDIIRNYFGQS